MGKTEVCFFLCVLIGGALAAPKAKSSGTCTRDGLYIEEGQTVPAPVGKCYNLRCLDANKNNVGSSACPDFIPEPGYHLGKEDLSKPYPKCCPQRVRD